MKNHETFIPKFVSIVAVALGCLDLLRGFMHTILLEYAATNIAGLDLATSAAADLLRLMGSFGISNFITGALLIILGLKARPLALAMLGVIPLSYLVGGIGMRLNTAGYVSTQADWGGLPMMIGYNLLCIGIVVAGVLVTRSRKQKAESAE